MSRPASLAILTLLGACGTESQPAAPTTDGPRFTVSGMVYDSLASRLGPSAGASGVRVSVNGVAVVTDSAGRFVARGVPGGPRVPIALQSGSYEPVTRTLPVDRDLVVSLPLRRLAPVITTFAPGDTTVITVVDLQNRKSVERWRLTQARLANGSTQWTQHGDQWVWTPVDSITWRVTMPQTSGAAEFDFDVHDVEGYAFRTRCDLARGCDHLAPVETDP